VSNDLYCYKSSSVSHDVKALQGSDTYKIKEYECSLLKLNKGAFKGELTKNANLTSSTKVEHTCEVMWGVGDS
jgi:hypothetical protein